MAGRQQSIDLHQLPISQLNQLSQQLESEIELLSNSMNQLKHAQTKFMESQECVGKLAPDNKDKDILVPLTSSMYVPGQLADVEKVTVDIGTGYYVEMTIDKAKGYFSRKIEYVTKQMEKLQPVLQEKYKIKQATVEILQLKVAQASQVPNSAPGVKS